jgi:D-alanyl-lipoteichoic acid acyltransferase DltB (MBOAT superfamily)
MKPWFFFESKIPDAIKKLTGINAVACSLGPFVFTKNKKEHVPESTIRHETIHFKQQLELLFVFQWILYGIFHLVGFLKSKDTRWAYLSNPFELEAYDNDEDVSYLEKRKLYSWIKYVNNMPENSK